MLRRWYQGDTFQLVDLSEPILNRRNFGGISLPVNSAGRIKMTQNVVPFAASMDEIPSRAISDEVSKPNPKRIPSGYIFQGLKHNK